MKQIRAIALLIFVGFISFACPSNDDGHRYIKIINRSSEEIAFRDEFDWNEDYFYCNDGAGSTFLNKVPADSSFLDKAHSSWRDLYWEEYLGKDRTMNIFIVDAVKYYKYWQEPCDTIRKYVPILHRYQLKLEDLERMNWTVVYPPQE